MKDNVKKEIARAILGCVISEDLERHDRTLMTKLSEDKNLGMSSRFYVGFSRGKLDHRVSCTLVAAATTLPRWNFHVEFAGLAGEDAQKRAKELARLVTDVCTLAEGLKGRFG